MEHHATMEAVEAMAEMQVARLAQVPPVVTELGHWLMVPIMVLILNQALAAQQAPLEILEMMEQAMAEVQ